MAFIKNISPRETDSELVAAYRAAGDQRVLANLYQRYMDLVYGVCLKYLAQPEDARDAVINIYEEVVLKLRKFEVENFKAWLYTLAKNHCLMKIRSGKNIPRHMSTEFVHLEDHVHLNEVFRKEEKLSRMEECIGELAVEQQNAIRLFYLEEKSYKLIASLTGLELNSVRSYIQNGRRNLKICMEKKEIDASL